MPQPASLNDAIEDISPSYLYPHSWPPGSKVPSWPGRTVVPQQRASAVIGNELRLPAVWCELGTCIERFSHQDALGMRDIRNRAADAGWRQDALGRLACPRCQQTDPAFRATHPVVPRSVPRGCSGAGGRP